MLSRHGVLAVAIVATGLAACVAIPQEVRQTFAPADPGETSYFRRRPDAPPVEGFVAPMSAAASATASASASAPLPAPASASASVPAPAPATAPDGGVP